MLRRVYCLCLVKVTSEYIKFNLLRAGFRQFGWWEPAFFFMRRVRAGGVFTLGIYVQGSGQDLYDLSD